MAECRLDKLIRESGLAARREVRELVKSGLITVNGRSAESAAMMCGDEDIIYVKDRLLQRQEPLYIVMNKPGGCICASRSERHRTVIDILEEKYKESCVFPVGRLDKDSEGLLILTNDGEFCRRVIRPESKIIKRYYIEIIGSFSQETKRMFREGVRLTGGDVCLPADIEILKDGKSAIVSVSEGKTHQVKRMAAAAGAKVTYLKRLSVGGLQLPENMQAGEYRLMTEEERGAVFSAQAVEL